MTRVFNTIPGRVAAAGLAAGLTVAACGIAGSDASAGREIPRLGLEQELRIDGHEADLVSIGWLGVSPRGTVALLQWQDHAVRFFDEQGVLLGAVGGEGEGPGEFRRVVRAGWIADTLWVSDTQLRRVTLISPELEVVRVVRNHQVARPMPADSGRFTAYAQPSPFALYGDGGSLVWGIRPADPAHATDDAAPSPVFRLSPDGFIRSQVASIPSSEGRSVSMDLGGGSFVYGPIPFVPRPTWTVSPGGSRLGILTTDMAAAEPSYRVYVVDATGDVVIDRSFAFVPEPIPAERIDSAIEARVSRMDASYRDEMRAKMHAAAPSVFGEAGQLVIGSDDRVWVGMRRRADGTRWVALSPAGDPVGEIVLPPGVRLAAADAEHIWCIERDEFDVESVVRYRLAARSGTLSDEEDRGR